MSHNENLSIGVFIDGGYYAKINEGFAGTKEVNLKELLNFIRSKIAKDNNIDRRKLKALKTHVILLTWDPANTASTSRFLKEEVCTHMDMNSIISADATLLKALTV